MYTRLYSVYFNTLVLINEQRFNPPTTTTIKISQNVDILPKVYMYM